MNIWQYTGRIYVLVQWKKLRWRAVREELMEGAEGWIFGILEVDFAKL
ncbi:MAG: hypothetical protein IKO62_04210 [Bacteroidales bacterium]|nr:hypothetical protein [Bacteroidales bacterium]